MNLWLEITDGDKKGTRFLLREGLTIGRKAADVTLQDSKVSTLHARVEMRSDGEFWLVDAGSTNGIKFKGTKVQVLRLQQGSEFRIGKTRFAVRIEENRALEAETTTFTPPNGSDKASEAPFWTIISELVERGGHEGRPERRNISPFMKIVHLTFTKGVQAGTKWTLGYGPRLIGGRSLDLKLEEADVPGVCFRLQPDSDGVLFEAEPEADAKLNGRWVKSQLLKTGDVIDIKNTQIQIVLE